MQMQPMHDMLRWIQQSKSSGQGENSEERRVKSGKFQNSDQNANFNFVINTPRALVVVCKRNHSEIFLIFLQPLLHFHQLFKIWILQYPTLTFLMHFADKHEFLENIIIETVFDSKDEKSLFYFVIFLCCLGCEIYMINTEIQIWI